MLSGVNRGHNVAEDTLYSGTVGGAMEGALHGAPVDRVVAVLRRRRGRERSLRRRPRPWRRRLPPPASPAAPGPRRLTACSTTSTSPPLPAAEVRGLRATVQGHRNAATFGVQPQVAPNGRKYLWLSHGHGNDDTPAGSDARECHDGYVTVTPLRADLTAHDLVAPLARALG